MTFLVWIACAKAPPAPTEVPPPPDAIRAHVLTTEARAAYDRRDYVTCADRFADARPLGPVSPFAAYDAGCCAALAERPDEAFGWLEAAVAGGYRDPDHLSGDGDLTSLHGDPRWASVVSGTEANRDQWVASIHPELYAMFQADQADRRVKPIDWDVVGPRVEARRARVAEILAAGEARVSADWYHAAMVYQHGPALADTQLAQEYALKALEIEPVHEPARWLAAATEDRVLMRQNRPQKWGTQFHKGPDGLWRLWEVDPAVTDEERAEWNVPPIAEAQARAEQMNRDQ